MSAQRKYLDFELKIDDLGGGRYRSSVIDMPLGEGQAQAFHEFSLPFSDEELRRILAILSGQLNVSTAERERQARSFGEALFRLVFGGTIYTLYFSSRDRAQNADGLRVKLFLENAGAIASLPWEFLRDPGVDYIALSRSTPLVRHPRRLVIRPRPAFQPPLRVLVMVSSPKDMDPIDVQGEWHNLLAATETLRTRGLLELELLEDASLRTLQRTLRTREYHVFHYIGHSTFDTTTGQGVLALEDPYGEGSSFPVRGEDLARELSEENAIRLVVLNSCQSAVELVNDPFAGISSSLVARGIAAVVAMQFPISESAARAFSEEFYRVVAEGLPVDAAMSEARRAISNLVGGIEWATPVLFMRAADGMLFELGPAATATTTRKRGLMMAGGGVILVALVLLGLLIWRSRAGNTPAPDIDLLVDDIEIFPARPAPGEEAAIIVRITNHSPVSVGPIGYDFRQDVLDAAPSFAQEIKRLAPGDTATIFIPHAFNWWGAFVSEVRIDIQSDIAETDELNNIVRLPVVTSNAPFEIDFKELPGGMLVQQSTPVAADTFAAWGFRFEAAPGDNAACASAVPWIIVDGEDHYLGTGLPNDPSACTDAGLVVVLERNPVSGLVVQFEARLEAEYTLSAFDEDGEELDRISDFFGVGDRELEISGGFAIRLEVARSVFESGPGVPLHITSLSLFDPSETGR